MSWRIHIFIVVIALMSASCEKGDPVANEGIVLQLSVEPTIIKSEGDSAIVNIKATEADGRPVLDGIRIQLVAEYGSIDEEVRTIGGNASAVFTSDQNLGSITITARSGTTGVEATTTVKVEDRNTPIASSSLLMNPSNLPHAGGAVSVSILLRDDAGNPIEGKGVVFSSNYGNMTGNGTLFRTGSDGRAFDTLNVSNLPQSVSEITVSAALDGDTLEAKVGITENSNPEPDMVVSPTQIRVGETVFFDGSASLDTDGQIVLYRWNFGDGSFKEGMQVSHSFVNSRTYEVSLTVFDDQGAWASTTRIIPVGENAQPVASFNWSPQSPSINEPVFFNASASQDADGQIVSYLWNMGNGSTREGVSPAFAFGSARTYLVSLTVVDDQGASNTQSQQLQIAGNQLPEAVISFSPLSPRVGEVVTFDGLRATDSDGAITQWKWTFGDGARAEGATVGHSYQRAGDYLATLEVVDDQGGSAFETARVIIGDNDPPVSNIEFFPLTPNVGETVTFDGSGSYDNNGPIAAYLWDFDDGNQASGAVARHSFRASGRYAVTLTVTDGQGLKDVKVGEVLVDSGNVPSPSLVIEPDALAPPGGLVILNGSGTVDIEDPVDALRFRFNAIAPEHVVVQIDPGTGPIREARLENMKRGDRVFFLMTVQDTADHEAQITRSIIANQTPSNQSPNAVLTLDPASLSAPGGAVILNGSGSSDPDHDFADLRFDFSIQTTGGINVYQSGTGAVQIAQILNGRRGDKIVVSVLVTDPAGAQDIAFATLTLE